MTSVQLKISGFADYTEKEHVLLAQWKKDLEDLFRLFGFMGFTPRPVEAINSLAAKGGLSHQIYTLGRLQDGSMTDLALPFDRTVPLALYVAAHRQELAYPFKRFDISHSFRGERPQAGRFRAFLQADADVIDENLSPLAEVECLTLLGKALQALSIPSFTIFLNHIDIPKKLLQEMGLPEALLPEALRIIDKMEKIGQEEVRKELLALFPSLDLSLLDLFAFKGDVETFCLLPALKGKELPELSLLKTLFTRLENKELFAFSPGMVRGLDYYTGLVYETFFRDLPQFGSIASGGRYNKLVDSFVGKETRLEGFGISIGLTRLFDILRRESLLPPPPAPANVLIAYREHSLQDAALTIAGRLRRQHLNVDLYCGKSALGKQIAYADKKGIPFVFLLMGETFVIRDLRTSTQTEDLASLDLAIDTLTSMLSSPA